jgi:hypothetical protein
MPAFCTFTTCGYAARATWDHRSGMIKEGYSRGAVEV